MRIHFPSDARLKAVAKKLKDIAPEFGLDLNLRIAREAAASMYGYRNWEEARTLLRSRQPTPLDDEVAPEEAAERRGYQASRMSARLSIPRQVAFAIVDRLRPTGSAKARAQATPGGGWSDLIRQAEALHAADGAVFFISMNGQDRGICVPYPEKDQPGEVMAFLTMWLHPTAGLQVHADYLMEEHGRKAVERARTGNRDYSLIGNRSERQNVVPGTPRENLSEAFGIFCEGARERGPQAPAATTAALAKRMSEAFSGRLDHSVLQRLEGLSCLDAASYNLISGLTSETPAVREFFIRHPAFLPLYVPQEAETPFGWPEPSEAAERFRETLGRYDRDWPKAIYFFTHGESAIPEPEDLQHCSRLLEALGNSSQFAESLHPASELCFLTYYTYAPVPQGKDDFREFGIFFENATEIANRMEWDIYSMFDHGDFGTTWAESNRLLNRTAFTHQTEEAKCRTFAKALVIASMDPGRPLGPQMKAAAALLPEAEEYMAEHPWLQGTQEGWNTCLELAQFERDHGTVLDPVGTGPASFSQAVDEARRVVARFSEALPELIIGPDPQSWPLDLAASTAEL